MDGADRRWPSRLAAALGTVLGADPFPVAAAGLGRRPRPVRPAPRVVAVRSPRARAPAGVGAGRAGAGPGVRRRGHRRRGRPLRDARRRAAPASAGWRPGGVRPAVRGRAAGLARHRAPRPGRVGPAAGAAAGGVPPARRYGRRHSRAPRRRRRRPPLRRRQRLLPAGPRAVDGLLLRGLGPTRAPAWTPPRRPSSTWSAGSSGLRPGHAAARRRLRLGQPGAARGAAVRRGRRRHHAVRGAGGAGPQAGRRGRARPTGSTIRVQDYREVDDGPFDAISSIGHGRARRPGRACPATPPPCTPCCAPGGRLLNHAISWAAGATDLGRRHLHRPLRLPRRRADQPRRHGRRPRRRRPRGARRRGAAAALRADAARVGAQRSRSTGTPRWRSTSEGRARVWRLYMAASALAFEAGKLGVNQVLLPEARRRRRRRCGGPTGSERRPGRSVPVGAVTVESPRSAWRSALRARIGPRSGRGTYAW